MLAPWAQEKPLLEKIVAGELFLDFYDTDTTIENNTGVSIDWIFDIEGEDGFRKRETSVLKNLLL